MCSPGLECVNGWCGDPAYFNVFSDSPCQEDRDCDQRTSGEMCCLQLDNPLSWRKGKSGLRRKCCNNQHGVPIKAPDRNLTVKELQEVTMREGGRAQQVMTYFQLDQGLIYLRVYFLDLLVCDGLSYHTRRQLTGCSWYLSTTASTTSTRESADSQSRVSTYEGMLRNIAGNIKTFLLPVIYSQQYFRPSQLQLQLQLQLEIKSERYFQSTSVPVLEWRKSVEGRKYFENFLFVDVGF